MDWKFVKVLDQSVVPNQPKIALNCLILLLKYV